MLQIPKKRSDPMQSYPESDDEKIYQQQTRQIYYTKVEGKRNKDVFHKPRKLTRGS